MADDNRDDRERDRLLASLDERARTTERRLEGIEDREREAVRRFVTVEEWELYKKLWGVALAAMVTAFVALFLKAFSGGPPMIGH